MILLLSSYAATLVLVFTVPVVVVSLIMKRRWTDTVVFIGCTAAVYLLINWAVEKRWHNDLEATMLGYISWIALTALLGFLMLRPRVG